MARHEKDLFAAAGEPLSISELLALLGEDIHEGASARKAAIARYLSAGEGWDEAAKRLGGAFAEADTGLRERKGD